MIRRCIRVCKSLSRRLRGAGCGAEASAALDEHGGFMGPFDQWQEAVARATGYADRDIFDRTVEARLKVLNGEAAFERDTVVFDKPDYAWPLLAHLLWIASLRGGRLSVVDYGGSLGSTYYQHDRYLQHVPSLSWRVIEQRPYVEFGRQRLADGRLSFHETWEEALAAGAPDAVLLSSVIMYVPEPFSVLAAAVSCGAEFIIVDRTPLIGEANDKLMVEVVPRSIFRARLPYWFISEARFRDFMGRHYEPVAEFGCGDHPECEFATYGGWVFRKKAA